MTRTYCKNFIVFVPRAKRITAILSIFVLLALFIPTVSNAEISNDTIRSIVKIRCPIGNKIIDGSGVIISSDGYIVTNKHVVSSDSGKIYTGCGVAVTESKTSIPQFKYKEKSVIWTAKESGLDLALLKLETNKTDFSYTPIFTYAIPKVGVSVNALGYPTKGELESVYYNEDTVTHTQGSVTGLIKDPDSFARAFIKTDAKIANGNSGGGAFTKYNEFLGITSATLANKYNVVSLIIPTMQIRNWLFINDYKFLIQGEVGEYGIYKTYQYKEDLSIAGDRPSIEPWPGTTEDSPPVTPVTPSRVDSGSFPVRIENMTDDSVDICWPSLLTQLEAMQHKPDSYKFMVSYSADRSRYSYIGTVTDEDAATSLPAENGSGKVGYYCFTRQYLHPATTYYFRIETIFDYDGKWAHSGYSNSVSAKTLGDPSIISDGMLIRTGAPNPDHASVYYLENGVRRGFPTREIFLAKGLKDSDVVVITRAQMDAIPLGSPITASEQLQTSGGALLGVSNGSTNATDIPEGALIRAHGDIDIYIVKYVGSKKFKRLILSPSVFNNYGHLRWEDVMDVDQSVIDSFTTSELVRAVGDEKIYKLYPQGDTGEKRWIKTPEGFARNSWDQAAIYEINTFDRDSYITGDVIE